MVGHYCPPSFSGADAGVPLILVEALSYRRGSTLRPGNSPRLEKSIPRRGLVNRSTALTWRSGLSRGSGLKSSMPHSVRGSLMAR